MLEQQPPADRPPRPLRSSRWGITVLILILAALPALAGRTLVGRGLYNAAQLAQLHGQDGSGLLEAALAWVPDDERVRWQTGLALAAEGDYQRAAQTLQPLLESGVLTDEMRAAYLNILLMDGQVNAAQAVYAEASDPAILSPGAAAALLARRDGAGTLGPAERYALYARLFGLDPSREDVAAALGFLRAGAETAPPQFGAAASGAVQWRSLQAQAPSPAAGKDDPCEAGAVLGSLGVAGQGSGPNLIANGGLEEYDFVRDQPQHWTPIYTSQGDQWSVGAFVVGVDPDEAYTGTRAMRFDGLLVQPIAGRDSARAGYQGATVDLIPGGQYILCLVYRADRTDDTIASFQLTGEGVTPLAEDFFLPPGGGAWQRVNLLVTAPADGSTAVAPLLRIWKTGSIWIDDITLQPVELDDPQQAAGLKIAVEPIEQ